MVAVGAETTPLTDNPASRIDDDLFGFAPFIEELHQIAARATPLPLTVGVFGPWGAGKSSFLKMWQDHLAFAPENRTLWFNPWKYDQKVEVWAALIHSLLAELQAEEPSRAKAARLARAATWLTVKGGAGVVASVATGGLVDAKLVDAGIDALTQSNAEHYRSLNRFEEDFADAVDRYLGPSGRLFVFVDDLDRCTAESAVTVLEALKLFVGNARCVFVLAMDFDVLAAAAGGRFPSGGPEVGAAYLEKIVQVPFFLPDVGFDRLRASVAGHVGDDLADSEAFWELVLIGFGANPRKVKRFVNVLNLATAVLRRLDGGPDPRLPVSLRLQLAELLIIRSEHRAFFRHLQQRPEDWRRLEDSPALPPPTDGPVRADPDDESDPALRGFLAGEGLVRLLMTRPGSRFDHPPAPDAADVRRLMSTVRLTP
jgi:hypothetical protein